jgi:hypothetical protein
MGDGTKMVRSVESWEELRRNTMLLDFAHFVLDDLRGYPAESEHRDDDAASLVNLFRVLANRRVKRERDESD